MSKQSANAVVMIRPSRFFPKPETAQDNAFQQEAGVEPAAAVAARALAEFGEAVRQLRDAGITVQNGWQSRSSDMTKPLDSSLVLLA